MQITVRLGWDALKVFKTVICRVFVDVMNLVTLRDRAIASYPHPLVAIDVLLLVIKPVETKLSTIGLSARKRGLRELRKCPTARLSCGSKSDAL
jgi:hypothetical protein